MSFIENVNDFNLPFASKKTNFCLAPLFELNTFIGPYLVLGLTIFSPQ